MILGSALMGIASTAKVITNLLGASGNLQTDSNADGLADDYTLTNAPTNLSVSNGVQTFTPSEGDSGMYRNGVSAIANNIYYCCAYATASYVKLQFRANASTYRGSIATNIIDTFVSVQGSVLENNAQLYPWILGNGTIASAIPVSFRQHMVFNLTSIFGTNNESTQAHMNAYMQGQSGYFTQNIFLKGW